MIRERILFRLFFSLLLLLSFSPFCTYELTFQIHPSLAKREQSQASLCLEVLIVVKADILVHQVVGLLKCFELLAIDAFWFSGY